MDVASFGKHVFYIKPKKVMPVKNIKWSSGARYAEIERHMQEPLQEFQGPESENITMTAIFSASLGVNPIKELGDMLNTMRSGEVNRLIIGRKAYGTNKWVIEKISSSLERYDNKGALMDCTCDITFKSYATR